MNARTANHFISLIKKSNQNYSALLSKLQAEKFENEQTVLSNIRNTMLSLFAIEDEVIQFRLKKILNETNPFISTLDPEKIIPKSSEKQNLAEIFKKFMEQRFQLLQTLVNLPGEAWDRTGVHAREGHLPFHEFVRRMIEKDSGARAKLNDNISLN